MGARRMRVNLLIHSLKKLVRSFILLAYYATEFVGFFARSVSGAVAVVRWIALSAQYTVSVFNSAYRHLRWWGRSGGATVEICSGRDMDCD